jgi:hypothetical protein
MKKRWMAGLRTTVIMLGLCGVFESGYAGTIPYGVMNDVSYDTVVNDWGWQVVYIGDYSANATYNDLFGSIAAGSKVMLAAIHDGSTTFDVLAAASLSDITTITDLNVTHAANGAEWYYNNNSMGFAGLGDTIFQNSADINGSAFMGTPERDRLSWHTNGSNSFLSIDGGWRSGDNINLNVSTDWSRLVLVQAPSPTPEPVSTMLLGTGIAGFAIRRLKRKKS